MVYYKPVRKDLSADPYDRKYQKDTYWMLGFYLERSATELKDYLKRHGYRNRYNTGSTKAVLLDAVGRYQRGLLSYDQYSTEKLREFCHARALPTPKAARTFKLARILEEADDTATFPRFLELPAELRTKIYELHFSDYDEITFPHRQPPLTLVPRIRAEALPIFYGRVAFAWDLSINQSFAIRKYQFVGNSYELLQMPAANLTHIRNFKIHATRVDHGYGDTPRRHLQFSILVSQRNNVTKKSELVKPKRESLTREKDIAKGIRELLLKTGYWEVTWQLQHGFLLAIEELVNGILHPHYSKRAMKTRRPRM